MGDAFIDEFCAMRETRWYFGYRCEIIDCEGYWYGDVAVPRWHPIRSCILDEDRSILLIWGEWIIPVDECSTRGEVLDAVQSVAARLRAMQMEWDQLSPYEREYLIW